MKTMASNPETSSRGLELKVPGVELSEYMCSKTFSTFPRGKEAWIPRQVWEGLRLLYHRQLKRAHRTTEQSNHVPGFPEHSPPSDKVPGSLRGCELQLSLDSTGSLYWLLDVHAIVGLAGAISGKSRGPLTALSSMITTTIDA